MIRKLTFSVFIPVILSACTGLAVRSDYDSQIDFKSYKTYTLCLADQQVENKDQPLFDNSLNRNRIKKAIENEMNRLGYVREDSAPQLLAGFHIIIKDRTVMSSNCRDFGEYQYWPECQVNTYYYTEGTLIIYVTDISKNQVIWQGSAEGVLDMEPRDMEKAVNRTVSKIFEKYPLEPGSHRPKSPSPLLKLL